jgi:SpoVK/Ycf46/Vps4 family AAA+-type ATPase
VNASAMVLQLCRAHYMNNEVAFASAAGALARSSKSDLIRKSIFELVQSGSKRRNASPPPSRSYEATRLEQMTSSFVQPLEPVSFEDLVLESELQLMLDEISTEIEYSEELQARKLRPRNRLLFFGPPGDGKTSSAAALATALDLRAYGVSIPRLVGSHLGETGSNLGKLFEELRDGRLIVFDEIDAIGGERGTVAQACDKEMNATVNTLLTLMDRHRDGVLVATTNRPDILDPALLRRFDEQIEFPPPSLVQKRNLAEKLCAKFDVPVVDVSDCLNFDAVAKRCETEARRVVMAELLAADAAAETETEDEENGEEETGT